MEAGLSNSHSPAVNQWRIAHIHTLLVMKLCPRGATAVMNVALAIAVVVMVVAVVMAIVALLVVFQI